MTNANKPFRKPNPSDINDVAQQAHVFCDILIAKLSRFMPKGLPAREDWSDIAAKSAADCKLTGLAAQVWQERVFGHFVNVSCGTAGY